VNPALLLILHAASCPASTPVPGASGLSAVAKLPAAEAMALNGEGKQLYRQERWNQAREKYQAALAADPDLLGARLNIACSYSRQIRYVEAADEAAKLIRQAFVPWNREVEEAADLGILQSQPAYATVQAARAEAAVAWGKQARTGIFFVARTKPPVNVTGEGVLVLGLNQEVFAWIPETGRFFQVTAEDGRVLAFVVSADGRRIAYFVGGKVVRMAGKPGALRGLSLRVLELPTMSLGPAVPIPGDASRVELWFSAQPELKVTDVSGTTAGYRHVTGRFENDSGVSPGARAESVVLTGLGVEPAARQVKRGKCSFALAGRKDPSGLWRIQVSRRGAKPFTLDTRYGAGLSGMPFPTKSPSSPTAAASVKSSEDGKR
jgi:hypothetical protein